MLLLGLTGSIGMGKSTVSRALTDMGIPVMDSDAVVHEMYAPSGAAVEPIDELFPGAKGADGGIDRKKLGALVLGDDDAMVKLEALVHPLVDAERARFLRAAEEEGQKLVAFDIPLLYEKGYEGSVDVVIVVSADAEAQRARVLARPGMTPEKFESILARQVPDEEKRRRADVVIDTGCALEETKAAVRKAVDALTSGEIATRKTKR